MEEDKNIQKPLFDIAGDLIITPEDYYGVGNVCICCGNNKKELNSDFCSDECDYRYFKI